MYQYLLKIDFLADKKKRRPVQSVPKRLTSPLKAEEAASDLSINMIL